MKYKLYHGSSSYLSLERVHSYISEIKATESSTEIKFVDADSCDPDKLLDLLSSQDLFSPKRAFILKRLNKNKKKDLVIEKISTLLTSKDSLDILIFWEDQKIKANTKYFKIFKEEKSIEEADELNKRSFIPWLRSRLQDANLKIEPDAIKDFARRTNYDPERSLSEIEKFCLNDNDKIITKEDINLLITDTLEENIWALIDAINQWNKPRSIEILENLTKQSVDPNYTISMLGRNIRLVTLTKFLLQENHSSKDIASLLKVPPFLIPSLISTSRSYKEEKLVTIYSKLSNLDFQIKTGKIDGNLGLTLICPYL
ncbi:MAG: DNA polymerase III subunit delta [Candidatus Dojkabacteria bacterium]